MSIKGKNYWITFFEEMKGITIEGNGATLMFHGKMTMIAFVHCQQIKFKESKI